MSVFLLVLWLANMSQYTPFIQMANKSLVQHNFIQISLFSLFCSIFLFSPYRYHKRNSRIELCRIRVYGFHSWLKLKPCFLIGGDHWIKKGILIWLHRKGGGLKRHYICYMCLSAGWKVVRYLPISIAPALESIHKCIFDYALPFVHCIHTTHTHTYYINHDFFGLWFIILRIDLF